MTFQSETVAISR